MCADEKEIGGLFRDREMGVFTNERGVICLFAIYTLEDTTVMVKFTVIRDTSTADSTLSLISVYEISKLKKK